MKKLLKTNLFLLGVLSMMSVFAADIARPMFEDVLSPQGNPLIITIRGDEYLIIQHKPIEQEDSTSCALHALKNSIHIDNLLRNVVDLNLTKKRIMAEPESLTEKSSQGTSFTPAPLLQWRKIMNKPEGDIHRDSVRKLIDELYYDKSIGIFDQIRAMTFESLEDDQLDFLIDLQKAIKNKTPSVHAFLLGDMQQPQQLLDEAGVYKDQGHGHWFALTIQIDKTGNISFHYCNSSSEFYDPSETIRGLQKILNTLDLDTLEAIKLARSLERGY